MTDIEGFLTIYGHSDNLLNNKYIYIYIYIYIYLFIYMGSPFDNLEGGRGAVSINDRSPNVKDILNQAQLLSKT